MKLDSESKKEMAEILSQIECQKGYIHPESCFENPQGSIIIISKGNNIVECFSKHPESCPHAYSFGEGHYCKCKVRDYIAQKFNI